MGNAWYCRKCEEGKINISKACINRVVDEETGEELSYEQQEMNKLKCADDMHSRQSGINVERFEELCDKIEDDICERPVLDPPCRKETTLLECLRKTNSLLLCQPEMKEYLECIDTFRIRRIKEHIEEERQQKRIEMEAQFNE